MMTPPGLEAARVKRLVGFGLNTVDLKRLTAFYERAFGGSVVAAHRRNAGYRGLSAGLEDGAQCRQLAIGESTIELRQFDVAGCPYPAGLSPYENSFQHFAFVVADMTAAYQRLLQAGGWTAISSAGPQRLPGSSGGVTAFKFRDPDGHPLELLSFPPGKVPPHWQTASTNAVLGIDHSAISSSDAARSTAFYQALGLEVAGRSLNQGIEQELLDGVAQPIVDVIALAPPDPTPHVEVLHYRGDVIRVPAPLRSNDIAATRLVFEAVGSLTAESGRQAALLLQDPDGHHVEILP